MRRPVRLQIKQKKYRSPKRGADELPFPMNCLCSTCRLTLIPGGLSASTEVIQEQSHSQHARTEAHVVVNPIGWAAVVMQSGHVTAHPDSNIRDHIYAFRIRIWFMLIDGGRPV